ncbi:MAG: hypothetical protein ABIP34_01405 [Rhodoferax sp.]|uniref:hypothetical protein n=1 Tax=Rhodoferax sp. TaxID=50421 RepID=UPI003265C088
MNETVNVKQKKGAPASKDAVRNFLALENREPVVTFAQTRAGKLLVYAIAFIAMQSFLGAWASAVVVGAALVVVALPARRTTVVFFATWALTLIDTAIGGNDFGGNIDYVVQQERFVALTPEMLAIIFLLVAMCCAWVSMRFVARHPQSMLARRPLLTMLAIEASLCIGMVVIPVHGLPRILLWSSLVVLTPFVWFFPLAIVDMRSRDASSPLMQLAVQRPFWSPTYLPFGKGAAFLRKHLSQTPRDIAVTQIKAVKLLLWANLLMAIRAGLAWSIGEQMQVPSIHDAIDAYLNGRALPIGLSWGALVLSTFRYSLQIAMWADIFIGGARLAGYRLPRGSWRPLESRTLMEYFNRFHFYFKELLVDFFFVPTFFAVFRKRPRLRMFFATFMAAGVGNAIWHFLRDIHLIATIGIAEAISTYTSYMFYCVLLAIGVGLSQVRANLGIRPPSGVGGRIYSFLFVWSFVVSLRIFSDESRNHSLGERFAFFLSLFGLNLGML